MKVSLETGMRDIFCVALSLFALIGVALDPALASTAATDASAVAARRVPPAATLVAAKTDPALVSPTGDVVPGPFYVDFRARTAASYGHAFTWFGKSSQREVDVAGLHPATDSPVPYMLGHVMWVPSETGASYGDLDEQYLTANYRVYLTADDAEKVFAYIRYLQANTPFWNATTTNCTWFIGRIATFMGLKVPSHLLVPEDYVNTLKKMNNGVQTAHLAPGKKVP